MSPSPFYREQAAGQQIAADAATLDNVRERCQRASDSWTALAARSERADEARVKAASDKMPDGADHQPALARFDEIGVRHLRSRKRLLTTTVPAADEA